MKTIKYFRNILCGSALLFLFGACTSDAQEDAPDGSPASVRISLSAPYNGVATKADGTPTDPESDNEKILSWFLVFVNKEGKVEKILDREAKGAVEQETFSCVLPSGTYKVFAFANMDAAMLESATGFKFNEGENVDVSKLQTAAWNDKNGSSLNLNLWSEENPIPMTGYREVTVKNTIEERFSIEVVRMVSKIEFKFTNPDQNDVTITEIRLDPITSSPVSLFPTGATGISYAHLGNGAFTPLANAEYARLSYPTNLTVKGDNGNGAAKFYCKESISSRENENSFTVGLQLQYADGGQTYLQYNLTRDIKDYINRNDRIVIPVTLSAYDVTAEAIFYPPIGGYPAMMKGEDAEGSQIFTFGTQGDFVITPKVIDRSTGRLLKGNEYEVGMSYEQDENGIVKSLKLEEDSGSLPYEIRGTLNSTQGSCKVTLTIKIGEKSYTRYIYLIRKNA